MHERAAALTDAADRNAFFALPLNREIETAFARKGWLAARAGRRRDAAGTAGP
jgi:hypothetical protein